MRKEGERKGVKEEGNGGELGSDLELDPDFGYGKMMRILWILIRNT